jgi:hypothetical protein
MCSSLTLIYAKRNSPIEIQVLRVGFNDFQLKSTGEKISSYELKHKYQYSFEKTKALNDCFKREKKAPAIPKDLLGEFHIKRSPDLTLCTTGKGMTIKRKWQVWWSDELLEEFSTKNMAMYYITEKINS